MAIAIAELLERFFNSNPHGRHSSPSYCVIELETSIERTLPICAESLSELLDLTNDPSREEPLSAEGLEEILRYIGNG